MDKKNLIEEIKVFMNQHELKSVCLFINNKYDIKSLASAYALKEFLEEIQIKTYVIVKNTSRIKDEYNFTVSEAPNEKFLAIAIGCKDYEDIENKEYEKTFVLFNVYGPLKVKGYGVLNFTEDYVGCTAEIVYEHIKDYCEKYDLTISKNIAQNLYTGIVAGTNRYGINVKANTFAVAKELIDLDIDYVKANYFVENKNPIVIQIQSVIYKYMIRKGNIIYAVIPNGTFKDDITHEDIFATLELFKKIDKINMWIAFVEKDDGYVTALIQTKPAFPYSAKAIAIKNNGIGNRLQAKCNVPMDDINKILREANEELNSDYSEIENYSNISND